MVKEQPRLYYLRYKKGLHACAQKTAPSILEFAGLFLAGPCPHTCDGVTDSHVHQNFSFLRIQHPQLVPLGHTLVESVIPKGESGNDQVSIVESCRRPALGLEPAASREPCDAAWVVPNDEIPIWCRQL